MTKKFQESNIEEIVELSLVQGGGLFAYLKRAQEKHTFNVQIVLDIDVSLNVELMKQSLSHVQQNNPVLRSIFSWELPASPLQLILKESALDFFFADFSGKHPEVSHAQSNDYLRQDRNRPFDLTKTPVRFGVIRLSDCSHLFHVTYHRILLDSISAKVLLKEIFSVYDILQAKGLPVSGARISLREISKQLVDSTNREQGKQYWADYLKDYQLVNVSSGKSGSVEEEVKTIRITVTDLLLNSFAVKHSVTEESVVIAAYGLLLLKYLYTEDVVFGTTVSARDRLRRHGDVVGNFENTLPVRVIEGKDRFFLEVVQIVNNDLIRRKQHQDVSYFDIKQATLLPSTQELFDSVLTVENSSLCDGLPDEVERCGVKVHSMFEHTGMPLHVRVSFEDALRIDFTYNAAHINEDMVSALSKHLPLVIRTILDDPFKSMNQICILTESEQQNILHKFNDTVVEVPKERTIIGLFEEHVKGAPERRAIYSAQESLTYEELGQRVNRLTQFLQRQGVRQGDVVALLMNRSIEFVVCAFAILKAGAKYLPIDTGNPGERINYLLHDSRASILVTTENISAGKVINNECRIFCYDRLQHTLETFSDNHPESREGENVYVIYTSGSTGAPKGVMGTRSGLLNRLEWGWKNYPMLPGEICCLKTNIGFVDHVVELFSPLLSGTPLRVFSEDEVLDIPRMYGLLVEEKITRISLVPTYLKALITLKNKEKPAHAFRYVFCSGEYLPTALARKFYAEFSDVVLVNIYGSTEVSADVTYYNVERHHVEDVLKYFKKYALSSNSLFGGQSQLALEHDGITFPDVSVSDLAINFQNASLSEYPTSIEKYFSDFQEKVLPYCVQTASPRFIGHMTSVLPDYVHDISKLISQLNQNLVKIETSKSLTFIEREAIAMLHRIFYSFQDGFYAEHVQKLNSNLGIITSGGSTANMSALLSARNKLLVQTAGTRGKSIYQLLRASGYEDFVIIGSRLMHYSFNKAASLLGIGMDNILHVKNDTARGRLDIEDLQKKIDYCYEHKLLIIAIVGIAGATETGCVDPLVEMGEIAGRNGIHFHVDAAWGGLVKFSDRYAGLLSGIELADSITFCGHKQLFLPQGISVCLFKDPGQLNYNSMVANYQATVDSFDFGRITLEGSKPGLSLCLHASLRILGKKGYALLLERGINLATAFARMIEGTTGLQLVSHHINILNYRYVPAAFRERDLLKLTTEECTAIDAINTKIQETQFLKGRTFVSKTKVRNSNGEDMVVFRAVLSNPLTTHQDLESVIKDQFVIIDELFGEKNLIDFIGDLDPQVLAERDDSQDDETRGIPIGKPISNTQVFILDRNHGLQPVGVPGELCIAGMGVADGYMNNDALTHEKFIANQFQEGQRLYKTGDLARWTRDGNIEFLGRLDDQIKIRGYRVALGEIENKLMSFPEIKDVVVVAKSKHGEKYLAAYYLADAEIPSRLLRNYLSMYLPDYMIPLHFVHLDTILVTSTGKANRRAFAEPAFKVEQDHIPPSGKHETQLVSIWSDLLGIAKENLSVNKCFFELGGHSLNLLILRKGIADKMKLRISVADLFRYSTIQAIAAHINSSSFHEDQSGVENGVIEISSVVNNMI